jgi:hypothetical protein
MVNATDKRFFWLALYAQPALWVALAVVAIVKFEFIWLTLVGDCSLEDVVGKAGRTWTNVGHSYCTRAYDHEHFGLFALRQVQPGNGSSTDWTVLGITSTKCWRSSHVANAQSWLKTVSDSSCMLASRPYIKCMLSRSSPAVQSGQISGHGTIY